MMNFDKQFDEARDEYFEGAHYGVGDDYTVFIDATNWTKPALKAAYEALDNLPHSPLCALLGGYGYCSCEKGKALTEFEKLLRSPEPNGHRNNITDSDKINLSRKGE